MKVIIVTNRSAMVSKYGRRETDSIFLALNMLDAVYIERGLSSFVLLIDSKEQMSVFGAKNVTDSMNQKQVKDGLTRVCKSEKPDYIVLVGSSDIIPHQCLKHPEEEGVLIPSDLPYACSSPYSTPIDSFLNTDYMVSRIPDVVKGLSFNAINEAHAFIKLINGICRQKSCEAEEYRDYFAVASADFKGPITEAVTKMFGNSNVLQCCPPHKEVWEKEQLECLFQYYVLYGFESNCRWCQDKEGKDIAFDWEDNDYSMQRGTVAISQCSYGAQLFPPVYGRKGYPVCNEFLYRKATAFLGITCKAYKDGGMGKADSLVQAFVAGLKENESLGEAFRNARSKIVKDKGAATAEEKMVSAQFILYGDAAFQPIKEKEN